MWHFEHLVELGTPRKIGGRDESHSHAYQTQYTIHPYENKMYVPLRAQSVEQPPPVQGTLYLQELWVTDVTC